MSVAFINYSFVDTIDWALHESGKSIALDGNTYVWRVRVNNDPQMLHLFESVLNHAEIEKANRFFKPGDRDRFVVGRGALRYLLGNYLQKDSRSIEILQTTEKKPFILNNPVHFNVTHSGNWVLIAIAETEVGIDVEQKKQDFAYQELLADNFSEKETAFINSSKNSLDSFYVLWTRKESLLKATGKGITAALKQIDTTDGINQLNTNKIPLKSPLKINTFSLDEQHIASVAYTATGKSLIFKDFNQFYTMESSVIKNHYEQKRTI